MSKRQLIILSILTAIIVVIVLIVRSNKPDAVRNTRVEQEPVKFIKTLSVKNDTLPLTINTFGRVVAARKVNMSTEVQGTLLEGSVPLKMGASFSEGQLIYRIDDEQTQYSLRSLKAKYLNLVASVLPDINIDYPERANQWKQFFEAIDVEAPLPDLPVVSSTKEKTFLATRNVLSDYYSIKSEEERLKKYRVRAPFDGSFVEVFAEAGATVSPGTNVASIVKNRALEVRVPVDVNNIHLVRKNAPVHLSSQDGRQQWVGSVIRVAQTVNSNTQSIDVFVQVERDSDHPLFDGMYLNADIEAGRIPKATELTRRALQDDHLVYLIQDSSLVERNITISKFNAQTFVTTDLPDDAVVVIEPVTAVNKDQKVASLKTRSES